MVTASFTGLFWVNEHFRLSHFPVNLPSYEHQLEKTEFYYSGQNIRRENQANQPGKLLTKSKTKRAVRDVALTSF